MLIYYVILARLALVIHPKLKSNLKSSTKNETLGIKKSCGQSSAACSIEKILLETDGDFTKQPFSKKRELADCARSIILGQKQHNNLETLDPIK